MIATDWKSVVRRHVEINEVGVVESSSPASPSSRGRSSRTWLLLGFAALAIVVGILARERLFDLGDERHFDRAPLPRIKLNAPFIKSTDQVVDKMIELGEITQQDLVYDLGCGDGKIVISAAVQRGCRGVGFDIEPTRIREAELNAKLHGVEHLVTFEQADIFQVDLREADVIVMYLLPWMVQELVPQFEKCRPGTRILSADWKIDDVQPKEVVEVVVGGDHHLVHLYVTPLQQLQKPSPP